MLPFWLPKVSHVLTTGQVVWKGVNAVCARFLERASDKIIDVQGDDEDEDDEDEPRTETRKDQ